MSQNNDRLSAFAGMNTRDHSSVQIDTDAQLLKNNQARYVYIETKPSDPRQVKCYDRGERKDVWGTYQEFSKTSKERIFVPN
jgi:hypothetical protein